MLKNNFLTTKSHTCCKAHNLDGIQCTCVFRPTGILIRFNLAVLNYATEQHLLSKFTRIKATSNDISTGHVLIELKLENYRRLVTN